MQKNNKRLALTSVLVLLVAVAVTVMTFNSGFLSTYQNTEPSPTPTPPPTDEPTPTPKATIKPSKSSSSSTSSSSTSSSSSSSTPNPTVTPTPTATPVPSPSPLPTVDPKNESEVFRDDFASGDMNAWTDTDTSDVVLSIENNFLKCQTNYATNQSWGYLYKWLDKNYTSIYWRWYVYFGNLPTTDGGFIGAGGIYNSGIEEIFSPANSVCSLSVIRQNGSCYWRFSYADNHTMYNLTTTETVQAGTWYLVELQAIQGNGTGEARFYLENQETLNATGLVNDHNAGIDHVSIGGGITADQPVTWYCGGAVAATAYIGPESSPSPTTATVVATAPIALALSALALHTSALFLTKKQFVKP